MAELVLARDGDRPVRSEAVVLAVPERDGEGVAVWPGCGHLLGSALAILYGRTTSSPRELRASAAVALAMAARLEADD